MTDEPLVSIVVPVYNVENYLEDCLMSLTNQTYRHIEIILVNDGSTDNSGKIADDLGRHDSRITIIHKKYGGPSDARNAGINIAKGEYISFVDSDDYIDKSLVVSLLELAKKDNADIVQCDNSRDSSQLGEGTNKTVSMSGQDAFMKLMEFKTISPTVWGKLYKLSLFRDNGLKFPVGRLHEDTAILYKLIYFANKIICLDKVLYYYRINTNSIMNATYTDNHYESVIKYHEELDDFILNNKILMSKAAISRHKALRLLSVLIRLALHKNEKSAIYKRLEREYTKLSFESRDFVCFLGCLLVRIPSIFRAGRAITPVARKILGKA